MESSSAGGVASHSRPGRAREDPMEKVSLTYFVDFVLRSGTPKLTGVREYKERKDELSTDFYRSIREGIIGMHRRGECEAALDVVLSAQNDDKRRRIYPHVVAG